MKANKLIFVLLLVFFKHEAFAQLTFEKYYKRLNTSYENAITCIEADNNNYLVGLSQLGASGGSTDCAVISINEWGDTLWENHINIPFDGNLQSLCRTMDGNYLASGITLDSNSNECWWIMKLNSIGQTLWYQENFGAFPTYEYAEFMTELPDKKIMINSVGFRTYIFDSSGVFLSFKKLPYFKLFASLNYYVNNIVLKDSVFKMFGDGQLPLNLGYRLVKIKSNGDSISSLNVQSDSLTTDPFPFVESRTSGNFYASGRNFLLGSHPFGIIKYDSVGNIIWRKQYKINDYCDFTNMHETTDGGLVISGAYYEFTDSTKAFLFKVDGSNGDSLWFKTYGGSKRTTFRDFKVTSDSGYLACGARYAQNGINVSGSYIVKTDKNGVVTNPLDVLQKSKQVAYLNLYPNPSSSFTSIHYVGVEKNPVLTISNLQGQIIYSQALIGNDDRAIVSTSTLGAGYYFCSITDKGKVLVIKKLVVIN